MNGDGMEAGAEAKSKAAAEARGLPLDSFKLPTAICNCHLQFTLIATFSKV